jgi:endonuclease YncB( thermonuclease family)
MSPELGLCLPCEVLRVLDGDTVEIKLFALTVHLRLLNCWAPEIHGNEKPQGDESKKFLQGLVTRGTLKAFIPFKGNGVFANILTLGRVLGRLYVADQDVSEIMCKHGFATPTKAPPSK